MQKADLKHALKYWDKTIPSILGNKIRDLKDSKALKEYYPNYCNSLNRALSLKPRKSDTVYIFGSGASINNISSQQWEEISKHDTVTFNWFAHQQFTNIDYYLIKDISFCDRYRNNYLKEFLRFNRLLETNWKYYKDCLFILQNGSLATNANKLLYYRIFPKESKITKFTMYRGVDLKLPFPFLSVKIGTLITAIHFALNMNWKKIVIAGVDLYNRDYFWFNDDDVREVDIRRGAKKTDKHNTSNGIIQILNNHLIPHIAQSGQEIVILNPKSLLTEIFPALK